MKKRSTIWEWIKAILFAIITIILFRTFFFEPYTVPSSSMERSLLTGDYILVSKVRYGSRIPFTPLAFPFSQQLMPFSKTKKSYLESVKFPYFRLFGPPDVERGDIVVFNWPLEEQYPIDQRTSYIKRCVGIPGDTLEIKKGQVFINDHYSDYPDKLVFDYRVTVDNDSIDTGALKAINITEGGKMREKGDYWYALSVEDINHIREIPHIVKIAPMLEKKGAYSDYMFPDNEHFLWNMDFFGPLYIPKAGDSVKLTLDSLALYERIITVYENNQLKIKNDSVFINGKYKTYYTFKMNYYFMMGDNRHNSADSRFWGFVPEDHIEGKALWVLISIEKPLNENKSKIRKDRWLKEIE